MPAGTVQAIDPIILGHNQFFGVDHLSQQKGILRERHFSRTENIIELVKYCYDQDVRGLMLSTHDRIQQICPLIKKDADLRDNLSLYPVLPYIAKYVRQANEKGIVNVVMDQLSGVSLARKLSTLLRGGLGLFQKDIYKMIPSLIDLELAPFRGLRIKAIFLHQALTDLALGLDLKDIFLFYHDYIQKHYNCVPAYCTYNLPHLTRKLKEYGLPRPVIMAPFNKVGFQMSPSLTECEKCLKEENLDLVAMGTLASGYLNPEEAYSYLYSLPNVRSTVVGVSTKSHADETFNQIRSRLKG